MNDAKTAPSNSVFVSARGALRALHGPPGGVQICTNEYLETLSLAGFRNSICDFDVDRRLATRLRRRFRPRAYSNDLPPTLVEEVLTRIRETQATTVFLNLVNLGPLAKVIRQDQGDSVAIVLLSHGLGCHDILHELRLRPGGPTAANRSDMAWLAGHLLAEVDQRKYIDHVFCLSESDVGLERWVGARSVSWLPRTVVEHPIDWRPVDGRLGFVGTLNHPPNAEGLELFLEALKGKDHHGNVRVRVVGGPQPDGIALARRFPKVDYLGPLDDVALAAEATTWSAAVHPLFCYGRGCSTKLAVLLGWGIPVVTTTPGRRGYLWSNGDIPSADSPQEFAELAVRCSDALNREMVRSGIRLVVRSSPTAQDVARQVWTDLETLRLPALSGLARPMQ